MNQELFDSSIHRIDEEYYRRGFTQGKRFLTCSKEAFTESIPVIMLDGHPGKHRLSKYGIEHEYEYCKKGSAYIVEQWKKGAPGTHAMQIRTTEIIKDIAKSLQSNIPIGEFAHTGLLTAYFNPFREHICEPRASSDFFYKQLWHPIFNKFKSNIWITLHDEPKKYLLKYIKDTFDMSIAPYINLKIQENFNYIMTFYKINLKNRGLLMVNIPSMLKYDYTKEDKYNLKAREIFVHELSSFCMSNNIYHN